MAWMIGLGIYFGLMTLTVVFLRFVHHCDDDMQNMGIPRFVDLSRDFSNRRSAA